VDSARSRSRITKAAVADEEHAFDIEIQEPGPVAPGASGLISYTLTNTSDKFIDGILFNISLPPGVSVNTDSRYCVDVGAKNSEGGQMISCQFKDELGKFNPGETQESQTDFSIAADAPVSTDLGDLRALVVPLDEDGGAAEDENDLEGPNVDKAKIVTADAPAGPLDRLRAFFGF
jgi:hypothetical protein